MSELVAALIGAVVGGLIGASATWVTTMAQWRREVTDRRLQNLENEVELLVRTLLQASTSRASWEDAKVLVPSEAALHTNTVKARSARLSPHLARLLHAISNVDDEATTGGTLVPSDALSSYIAVLFAWLGDPAAFEKERPSLAACADRLDDVSTPLREEVEVDDTP